MCMLKFGRRGMFKVLVFASGLLLLLGCPVFGAAEDYPTKPVIVYVGMAPGAAAGLTAQVFVDHVRKHLAKSQPFIINYKVGASGTVALDYVMKQPADGYTLMWCSPDTIVKMARDPGQYSFTKEDLSYIGTLVLSPHVLAVNRESSFKTLEEFIDYAKKNPGKLSYGSPGVESNPRLSFEMLMMRTGITLNHIPFSGGSKCVAALLGKHIDCYLGSTGTLGEHIKPGGGLQVLATLTTKRIPELPEVPTCLEKGYDVGERGTFQFFIAKKGTPKPILDTLAKAFKETADDPTVKTILLKMAFVPVNWGPEETEEKVNSHSDLAREIFKKEGLAK
jgi:tripartite-type tricarboxylate transporter receptor subunit TctC